MNEDNPINRPFIREWEINENSTHYDRMMAAPSDWEMKIMWSLWSSIMSVVVLVAGVVFIAVLSSRKARENPFNIYLIFLMMPDLFMSSACFVTCALNASIGHFYSEFACYFQSFYMVFGICANAWMNAVVAKELYMILKRSASLRTFKVPKKSEVLRNSFLVYIGSACVAGMGLIDQPWWPHKTGLLMGTACVPTDYDTASSIFFYCFYFPVLMGLPMGYVLYVCFRIYKDGLMPKKGKRRVLTVYFLRLAAVFVVMWLPAMFLFFVVGAWVNYWVVWAGGAWSHLQGLISAIFSLMKPDVYKAVCQLLHFEFAEEEIEDGENDTGTNSKNGAKTTSRANKSSVQHSNGKTGKTDKKRDNVSRISNFSEIVGWKTQVNDADEDDAEQQLSPDEVIERWKIQLGRQHIFSETVGWNTQAEPVRVIPGDESIIDSSLIVSNEVIPDRSEHETQQNCSLSSNNEYNPKVNFFETDVGKYYL